MTKVSIVIPCYNGGGLVQEAVTSALAQTHPAVEVLVVDDGSTDSTTLETLKHIEKAGQARVIRQENQGLCAARNRGIEESAGAYILPLDHDDEIYPDYAAKAVDVLDSRAEVGIVYGRAERFGATTGDWYLPDFSMGRMLATNLIYATAMFRRADWETVGGYSTYMQHGYEDYDLWLKILGLDRQVVRLDEVVFRYRSTEGSMISSMSYERQIESFAQAFAHNSSLYQRHANEFSEHLLAQRNLLHHFKGRYGRIENAISRLGAVRRSVRRRLAQRP
ncbi:glycosyltransferase family 2 protein [Nocardioides zhouii]|uniref:Glycosyltransferase family 2 protein n=1 Tax=Nocardioides zhouii TaxID=1168729 RepID=A0A4Q2SNP2_9ACTN|nr:glycosyltransferase family A protein [Nocardioides zhouii]RYC05834.1 glycosyltransferase family 2 protein [Nocardioides zhouii]